MNKDKLLIFATSLRTNLCTQELMESMERTFNATSRCICDEVSCIKTLAENAVGIIYFKDFPATFQEVQAIAASQWNSPPVIGIEELKDCVHIWYKDSVTKNVNKEYISGTINSLIPYRQYWDKKKSQAVLALSFVLLVGSLVAHYKNTNQSYAAEIPDNVECSQNDVK